MKVRATLDERFVWADALRILAISLVVLLHTFPPFAATTLVSLSIYALAKTSIPLFLMFTGALILRKHDTIKEFLDKRVRRILTPWICWSAIFLLTSHFGAFASVREIVHTYFEVAITEFTYLPMIFCMYLVVPFFKTLLGKEHANLALYYLLLWFLAICVLPYTQNSLAFPLVVDNGLVRQVVQFSGYVLLGYALSHLVTRESSTRNAFAIGGFALLGTYILSRHTGVLGVVAASFVSPTIVCLSASLFVFIKTLCDRFIAPGSPGTKTLRTMSEASFGVFLCHPLIIQLLQFMKVDDSFLYTPLALGLSFALIIFLQRIPALKRVVG